MIGMGDFASFLKRVRKVGKKVRGVVRKVRKRVRSVRGKARSAAAAVQSEVRSTRRAVAPSRGRPPMAVAPAPSMGPGTGAGVVEWAKANPLIVAGGALAAVLLFARKR